MKEGGDEQLVKLYCTNDCDNYIDDDCYSEDAIKMIVIVTIMIKRGAIFLAHAGQKNEVEGWSLSFPIFSFMSLQSQSHTRNV